MWLHLFEWTKDVKTLCPLLVLLRGDVSREELIIKLDRMDPFLDSLPLALVICVNTRWVPETVSTVAEMEFNHGLKTWTSLQQG